MGLTIALDPDCCGVPPLKLVLTLSCDGQCGMFRTSAAFRNVHGFMGSYHDAITAGWKDTSRDGARVMLCPACSGK